MATWGLRLHRYRDLAALVLKSAAGDQYMGQVKVARSSWQRLLGWRDRGQAQGVWLTPCKAVHTLHMSVALDLLWLNREQQVIHIDWAVPPGTWRSQIKAHSVIELPAGLLGKYGVAA